MKVHFLYILVVLLPLSACFSQKRNNASGSLEQTGIREHRLIEGKKFEADFFVIAKEQASLENAKLYRSFIDMPVVFRKCHFQKSFIASLTEQGDNYYTTFGGQVFFDSCYFHEDVNFRGAIFNGPVNFRNCMFYGNVNFEEIQCLSSAWFLNCFFKKEARFQNAFFSGKANFLQAVFDSLCSFQGAFFNQHAQFSNAKFWKYADFSLCTFNTGSFFNYTVFYDRVLFNNTDFRARAEFLSTTFKNRTEMRNCRFSGDVKFNAADFDIEFDLSESLFMQGKPDLPDPVDAMLIAKDVLYFTPDKWKN